MEIDFSQSQWETAKNSWDAWWAGEPEHPMTWIEYCDAPADVMSRAPWFASNIPMDITPEEVVGRYEEKFKYCSWHGDAVPKWWPNFGPGCVAGFLGAQIDISEDTVWFSPNGEKALSEIEIKHSADDWFWQRIKEISAIAASRWNDHVCIGYTDLGGNLDILASLRGTENLLMDLLDKPDDVALAVSAVTDSWRSYFDKLNEATDSAIGHGSWGPLWSPGKTYMLQSDFSYMISPDMFEQFVLPDLKNCCRHIEHSYYHLDGKGELPHLDMILSIEELHGVQWIPGDGQPTAANWPEVLNKIRKADKTCQIACTPQEAIKVAREHGGKGFMFHITGLPQKDVEDFLGELYREL